MKYRTVVQAYAEKYGPNAALLIDYFIHKVLYMKKTGKNVRRGRTWYHSGLKKIADEFGYLTIQQIRSAINKLIKAKILMKDNPNKKGSFSAPMWYSFVDENEIYSCYQQHDYVLPATRLRVTSNTIYSEYKMNNKSETARERGKEKRKAVGFDDGEMTEHEKRRLGRRLDKNGRPIESF